MKPRPSALEHLPAPFKERLVRLIDEMDRHVANGSSFDATVPPHSELTEALHSIAFASASSDEPGRLIVRYPDGTSTKKPFPVRQLWPAQEPETWTPRLHLGTLSFRHLDYDSSVDMYLVRDRETKHLSQAAIEMLAAQRMKEILTSRHFKEGGCITVYQTGLEPLVFGMYRAIAEHFVERNEAEEIAPLFIMPVYFQSDERDNSGSIWGNA